MTYRKTTYNPINTSENLACSFFSYEEKSCTEAYRFGFNGAELENEIYGEGNAYDLGLRMYDARLARMFSIDPRAFEYPWQSPYVYHRNSPIAYIDFMGGGDPDEIEEYTVQSGDNLGAISEKFGTTPQEIMDANPAIDWQKDRKGGDLIYAGENLNIPSPQKEKQTTTITNPFPEANNTYVVSGYGYSTGEWDVYVGSGGFGVGGVTIKIDRGGMPGFWEHYLETKKNLSYPLDIGPGIGRGQLHVTHYALVTLQTNSMGEILAHGPNVKSRSSGIVSGSGFFEGYDDNDNLIWRIDYSGFYTGYTDSFGYTSLNTWKYARMTESDSVKSAVTGYNLGINDTAEYGDFLRKKKLFHLTQ